MLDTEVSRERMKCQVVILLAIIATSSCCPLDCSQVQCMQKFDPFSCPEGTIYEEKASICGCCPGCVKYKGPGENCREGSLNTTPSIKKYFSSRKYITTDVPPVVWSDYCVPGLICKPDKLKCSNYIYNCLSEPNSFSKYPLACDVDGSYKAVQCKENGPEHRCFCYNKDGERIFGSDWIENQDKMKCLCSRLIEDLKKDKNNNDLTFHCSSNGNFEPLQCNRGMCYCADVYTGQPTNEIVPESLWRSLPCYNNNTMGDVYLRNCESQANAYALILKETQSHGSTPILSYPPCDPDGSYAPKQCEENNCYCKTRVNGYMQYSASLNSPSEKSQRCYCARDKDLFSKLGRPFPYQCNGNGNYNSVQMINGMAFCVDGDGSMISDSVPVNEMCDKLKQCVTAEMC